MQNAAELIQDLGMLYNLKFDHPIVIVLYVHEALTLNITQGAVAKG